MTVPPLALGAIVGTSFGLGIAYGYWRARQVVRHELTLWRLKHDRALGRRHTER